MSDKVQLIKEEIERQIEEGKVKCQQSKENNDHESFVAWSEHIATCGKILLFINSLPEEPASEDLEEELHNWMKENCDDNGFFNQLELACHFAEWGRNHFEDKSEMVSEETTIVNDWQYGKDPDYAIIPAIHQRIDGFNVGDIVKIIIVKEDYQ